MCVNEIIIIINTIYIVSMFNIIKLSTHTSSKEASHPTILNRSFHKPCWDSLWNQLSATPIAWKSQELFRWLEDCSNSTANALE